VEHLEHVELVFKKMCEHKLYGKLSKYVQAQGIGLPGSCHLGRGNQSGLSKIEAVKDWATPQDLKQLQRFLGLCNYYRIFGRNYSIIASPLSDLTKKAIPFKWAESQDKVFRELKTS
jgi:hypothetical protein